MPSLAEISQLCRLCLVKDQVNISIFNRQDDNQQIFHKISTCLPVKISYEDGLPKSVCDECSQKLDTYYQFWNTSSNSEKQLLQWLKEIKQSSLDKDASVQQSHSISPDDDVVLKEEVVDIDDHNADDDLPIDDLNVPTDPDYLMQQSYGSFDYQQEAYNAEAASNTAGPSSTVTSETAAVAAPKRKRRAAAMKPLPPEINSEEEDDPDAVETKIAKTEKLSDDEDESNPEPTTFVGLPTDNEQPGPSGLDKVTSEAPSDYEEKPIPIFTNFTAEKPKKKATLKKGKNKSPTKNDSKEEKAFRCEICGKCFALSVLLYNHRRYVHWEIVTGTPLKHNCDICNKHYVSSTGLKKHKLKNQCKVIKEQEELDNGKTTIKKVHCDVCDTTFKDNLSFALHLIEHSSDGKYSCHMCDFTHASRYQFEMHVRAHEGSTKHKCDICNKAFTVSTHAAEHKNVHTGEKPFQCEICGKRFMFSRFLSSHRRIAHWEIVTGMPLVKYDCTTCNKHYGSSTALKRHNLYHHNTEGIDMSVLCDICGKRLSNKEKLKFHKRIHTGYKPFMCKYCQKTFTRKELLKEHERVHTGQKPFICKFCGKGSTQKSALKIHERTHTGERPYSCVCEKGFVSKAAMNMHMKTCDGVCVKKKVKK